MSERKTGGCLCGDVRFTVSMIEPKYSICHCSMCRKWSAGPFMSVHCAGDDAVFDDASKVGWHQNSAWAERGFCRTCGSSLFYRLSQQPEAMLVVAVDALDDAAGISLDKHIYVDCQPAHYAFADECKRLTEAEFLAEMGIEPV